VSETGVTDRRVIDKPNYTNFNETDELQRSDNAHEYAKAHIYPHLFTPRNAEGKAAKGELVYTNGIRDGGTALEEDRNEGIDTTIMWTSDRLPNADLATPITTIQERSRHPKFEKYRDLTLTYMNPTGAVGDFFKCKAEFYLYGFFDLEKNDYTSAYLIQRSSLFRHIIGVRTGLQMQTNSKGQQFMCIDLGILRDAGIIKWERLDSGQESFLSTLPYQPIAM